jgi:hypothetical protein
MIELALTRPNRRPLRGTHRRLLVGLGMPLLAGACTGDSPVIGEGSVQAVVRGEVRGPEGIPVRGAVVATRVFRDGVCDPAEEPGSFSPAATGNSGEFLHVLVVPLSAPFTGCVQVEVTPPISSELEARVIEGDLLNFVKEGEPPDTLVLLVTLRSGG